MALVRWDPHGELASMEIDRLNRMFSELWGEDAWPRLDAGRSTSTRPTGTSWCSKPSFPT